MKTAFFLFAPKFSHFGAEIAAAWAAQHPGGARIHGICTGSPKVVDTTRAALGGLAGDLSPMVEAEITWARAPADRAALAAFEQRYPVGTMGLTIAADRRVGRGYVTTGATRPDRLADAILERPDWAPKSYVLGLYAFLEAKFAELKPDFVFCYAVAGAPAFAMSRVAARMGVRFVQLAPTRAGARYSIDTDTSGCLRAVERLYHSGADIPAPAMAAGLDYLNAFRARPKEPEYTVTGKAMLAARSTNKHVAKLLKSAAKAALPGFIGGSPRKKELARRKWWEARNVFKERRAMAHPFADESALPERFVYFPLHVSPEASTMVLAPFFTDQVAVIEALSKSLPADVALVVKEHTPMLGKRPDGFYERIANMPGVIMVSPQIPGVTLVHRCDLVVVISGTAAWEAFLLGKPSVMLADAQFRCVANSAQLITDFTALPAALDHALQQDPPALADIERYIGALFAESYELPSHLIWADYPAIDPDLRARVCADVATHLDRRLAELA